MTSLQLVAKVNPVSKLSYYYEELTAPDFVKAVDQSSGVCLLPFGILEKHGAHLPLGSDIFQSRKVASMAAEQAYSVIFPTYYVGQINEARQQPGTIAYSPELIWKMLQETCDELSRNGLKKIIIVNGHGGNNDLLRYFCMSQLHSPKNYVLIFFQPKESLETMKKVEKMRQLPAKGGHADEIETSKMHFVRPDLLKADQAASLSGSNQARLADFPNQYTGIWWYAQYPNHYAGDGSKSSPELGKLLLESDADQLIQLINKVKRSNKIEDLQNQFYRDAENPLNTKQ
jgi:creatinine amidohydrolase